MLAVMSQSVLVVGQLEPLLYKSDYQTGTKPLKPGRKKDKVYATGVEEIGKAEVDLNAGGSGILQTSHPRGDFD